MLLLGIIMKNNTSNYQFFKYYTLSVIVFAKWVGLHVISLELHRNMPLTYCPLYQLVEWGMHNSTQLAFTSSELGVHLSAVGLAYLVESHTSSNKRSWKLQLPVMGDCVCRVGVLAAGVGVPGGVRGVVDADGRERERDGDNEHEYVLYDLSVRTCI